LGQSAGGAGVGDGQTGYRRSLARATAGHRLERGGEVFRVGVLEAHHAGARVTDDLDVELGDELLCALDERGGATEQNAVGALIGERGERFTRFGRRLRGDEPEDKVSGDGVADVNISELIAFHRSQGVKATLTATVPPGRFGALDLNGAKVGSFMEKPKGDGGMINGGFFVLSPNVLEYLVDDQTIWEREPLERLAQEGELCAFQHTGFWQPMDTLRDKVLLEELWASGAAPWRVWS
jgi:glucose-1-phosphate cytidylyltransferase